MDLVETEDGWVAVRNSAVEEQASACQLLMLLVEKLQEHFYPYVEQSTRALVPLLKSPHEDVRSFAMVALPELVRATAKATVPDRSALTQLSEYCVGLLVETIAAEETLEHIMTGLQALKQLIYFLCTDWAAQSLAGLTTEEPPTPTPATSVRSLNAAQIETILKCAKTVLRDSLQRRAVLRAEAQVRDLHFLFPPF